MRLCFHADTAQKPPQQPIAASGFQLKRINQIIVLNQPAFTHFERLAELLP